MKILSARDTWKYVFRVCHFPCVWIESEHRRAKKKGDQRKLIYFTLDREGSNSALTRSRCLILLLIMNFTIINSACADNLGRIFTSSDERQELEKIRHEKTKPKEIVETKEIIEPLIIEKELVIRDALTLKGLVHRSDGKSTAWINDSNTFEGNLESQFIQVPGNKIKSDQVTIIMPDDSTNVVLKVGEAFTPEPIERDIVETVNTEDDR
jgi:hypothetical protein